MNLENPDVETNVVCIQKKCKFFLEDGLWQIEFSQHDHSCSWRIFDSHIWKKCGYMNSEPRL